MNIHHWDGHRNTRDHRFVSQTHAVTIAQGNVRRCSAHVEGDGVFKTRRQRGPRCANDTAGGTRENRTHWFFRGGGGGDAAAG